MPVFINEVVFRADVRREGDATREPADAPRDTAPGRDALVAEVTQAVIDHLERELDRIGER